MFKGILSIFKRGRVGSAVEIEPIHKAFKLKGFPDDRLFLIEANVRHICYANEQEYIESIVYEDGYSEYKLYNNNDIEIITAKKYDEILKTVKKQPIEIEYRRYMLESWDPIDIYKIDGKNYIGVVSFYNVLDADTWECDNILKEYIIEGIGNYTNFLDYAYWKETRLSDKK